jgi:hypothetical protein
VHAFSAWLLSLSLKFQGSLLVAYITAEPLYRLGDRQFAVWIYHVLSVRYFLTSVLSTLGEQCYDERSSVSFNTTSDFQFSWVTRSSAVNIRGLAKPFSKVAATISFASPTRVTFLFETITLVG